MMDLAKYVEEFNTMAAIEREKLVLVREAREDLCLRMSQLGYTQKDIAKALGCSPQRVAQLMLHAKWRVDKIHTL